MKALGDYIHGLGLKFGVYVTPGIPQNAVAGNTRIEGTALHAKDIADTSKTEKNYNCKHMYFINYSKPGAQEYVNSFANMFASWGADYLKIDGVGSFDIPDVQAWGAPPSKNTRRPANPPGRPTHNPRVVRPPGCPYPSAPPPPNRKRQPSSTSPRQQQHTRL